MNGSYDPQGCQKTCSVVCLVAGLKKTCLNSHSRAGGAWGLARVAPVKLAFCPSLGQFATVACAKAIEATTNSMRIETTARFITSSTCCKDILNGLAGKGSW